LNGANPSLILVAASLFAGPGSGGWVAGLAAGGSLWGGCRPLQKFSAFHSEFCRTSADDGSDCMLAFAVNWNWTGTWHYIGMEEKC